MPTTRIGRFVVTGTAAQIDSVKAAIAACSYPVADKLPRDIPVTFADLSQYQALGLFWTDGRIEVEQSLPAERAAAVFLAEAWHAIDQYLLTNGDRAALLAAAHESGPDGHTWFDNESYYADLGEAAMDVFLAAYTSYPATGIRWDHSVTQRLIDALRVILTPAAPPAPPLPPVDEEPAGVPPFPWAEVDPWVDAPHWWRKATVAAKAIRAWKAAGGRQP